MVLDPMLLRGARTENLRRLASAIGVRWNELTARAVLVDRIGEMIRRLRVHDELKKLARL